MGRRLSLRAREAGGRDLSAALAGCRRVVEELLLAALPERCVGCGLFETPLCRSCAESLQSADIEPCPRCGRPGGRVGASPRCPECFAVELSSGAIRSAFQYDGAAKDLVRALKFGGRRSLAPLMADLALPAFQALLGDRPEVVLTWVPAHPAAERRRGYNQAELIAKSLARAAGGLPVLRLARKVRRTAGQRTLDRAHRQHNLQGAFQPLAGGGRPDRIASLAAGGERATMGVTPLPPDGIVLVDDVYTTGATVEAVAAVLAGSTGVPVRVLTFARTVAPLPPGLV